MNAQVVLQVQEVGTPQSFGEDVSHIVCRPNTSDPEGLLLNKLVDGVELYVNMFDRGVPSLILGELRHCIIVVVQGGRTIR